MKHDKQMSAQSIRASVLLPPRQHAPELADALEPVIRAYLGRVGEVHGRRIEVSFVDSPASVDGRVDAARELVRESHPFALVASFTDGADAELASLAEELGVPLLATMSSHPRSGAVALRHLRDLVAGVEEQARVLAKYATTELGAAHVVIARDDSTLLDGADAVVVCCPASSVAAVIRASHAASVLVPASLIHPDALASLAGSRTYVSLPMSMKETTPESLALFEACGGSPAHRLSELAALASCATFVEALTRAGAGATRDALLDALDTLTAFRTGFVPPLTYTPQRHLGSTGAYVVNLHEAGRREVEWVEGEGRRTVRS